MASSKKLSILGVLLVLATLSAAASLGRVDIQILKTQKRGGLDSPPLSVHEQPA